MAYSVWCVYWYRATHPTAYSLERRAYRWIRHDRSINVPVIRLSELEPGSCDFSQQTILSVVSYNELLFFTAITWSVDATFAVPFLSMITAYDLTSRTEYGPRLHVSSMSTFHLPVSPRLRSPIMACLSRPSDQAIFSVTHSTIRRSISYIFADPLADVYTFEAASSRNHGINYGLVSILVFSPS